MHVLLGLSYLTQDDIFLVPSINSNKSVAFLYTNDKWAEKENRETIPFTVVKNNIKYLEVVLT